MNVYIHNLDSVIKQYVVAQSCDGEFWFWGSWDSLSEALAAADEIHGHVFDSIHVCRA